METVSIGMGNPTMRCMFCSRWSLKYLDHVQLFYLPMLYPCLTQSINVFVTVVARMCMYIVHCTCILDDVRASESSQFLILSPAYAWNVHSSDNILMKCCTLHHVSSRKEKQEETITTKAILFNFHDTNAIVLHSFNVE